MKTFWRRLENVLERRLEDVLKTSWRYLEEVFEGRLEDFLETLWRRLEDVWPRRIYWSWARRLEDVLKTSYDNLWLRRIYSSWSRRLEDVFINTNVCLLSLFPLFLNVIFKTLGEWDLRLCIMKVMVNIVLWKYISDGNITSR